LRLVLSAVEKLEREVTMPAAITREVMVWLEAMMEHGAITVDTSGRGDLSPGVKQAVEALHEVLAGGTIDVRVVTPGDAVIRADLAQKLQDAMGAANQSSPQVFAP
jgi:hypothetical protein